MSFASSCRYSRKAYSESTFTQTTEDFFRALENAFQRLRRRSEDAGDRQLEGGRGASRLVRSRTDAQGAILLPRTTARRSCRPSPTCRDTRARSSRGVKYVQANALKGRTFRTAWKSRTAFSPTGKPALPTRGSTAPPSIRWPSLRRAERPALRPLPRNDSLRSAKRSGRSTATATSKWPRRTTPCRRNTLARTVWVRWDARLVRIFNHRFEQIALHVRHEQGRFSTQAEHIAREDQRPRTRRRLSSEQGCMDRPAVAAMGRSDAQRPRHRRNAGVARAVEPDEEARREALEKACEIALSHGAFRLRTIRRQLLARPRNRNRCRSSTSIRSFGRWTITAAWSPRRIHRQDDRCRDGEGFLRHDEGVRGPREAKSPGGNTDALGRTGSVLDAPSIRRIPRQVAPQQSPTPFPRTLPIVRSPCHLLNNRSPIR